MTLYRYRKNGLLYLIYKCQPRQWTGMFYEAVPYNHSTYIGRVRSYQPGKKGCVFKSNMKLDDFEIVANK